MQVRPQNFEDKTFTDGCETAKNAKVFSLESFPLYGIGFLHACAEYILQRDCSYLLH